MRTPTNWFSLLREPRRRYCIIIIFHNNNIPDSTLSGVMVYAGIIIIITTIIGLRNFLPKHLYPNENLLYYFSSAAW